MAANPKTYKFSTFRKEAEKASVGKPKKKITPPFIIDDVDPPIEITAPTTVGRQLGIVEFVGPNGEFQPAATRMLLQSLCGDQFFRVWMLIEGDENFDTVAQLVKAILEHFKAELNNAQEAEELPGGSEDSSS